MDQLFLVAFGSLLRSWQVGPRDTMLAAKWFDTLWTFLDGPRTSPNAHLVERCDWLYVLFLAARRLLTAEGEGLDNCLRLVHWGRRRANTFLGQSSRDPKPLFNLLNPYLLRSLSEELDIDCGVHYLRSIALAAGLQE